MDSPFPHYLSSCMRVFTRDWRETLRGENPEAPPKLWQHTVCILWLDRAFLRLQVCTTQCESVSVHISQCQAGTVAGRCAQWMRSMDPHSCMHVGYFNSTPLLSKVNTWKAISGGQHVIKFITFYNLKFVYRTLYFLLGFSGISPLFLYDNNCKWTLEQSWVVKKTHHHIALIQASIMSLSLLI